jgi:hypothetical protein
MSIFSRFISRFFGFDDFKEDSGTWPRPARGLPPQRRWAKDGAKNIFSGAREVTNASTHRGWSPWSAKDHIASRTPRRMVNNTDYLRDGAHYPDTDARTGKIDWKD